MSQTVVFLSPLLSLLRKYIALDAPVCDQIKSYQMGIRIDSTTPLAV